MVQICGDCRVRDRSICGSLSDEELETLNHLGRNRHLHKGETLLWAGEEALVCANLLSGVLKVSAATADGREQIVGLLYPSDFVGRPFAEEAEQSVTALTEVDLCVFPRKPFEAALEHHARMERLLLRRTLAALDEARARMLLLGRKTAGEKLATFLLDLAGHLGQRCSEGDTSFDLPLTRAEIADVLGLTIETVSRQMTKLKQEGLIDLPSGRQVTIRDRHALEERAEVA
ncbi:Crp/Fnr family transcriptional regulator [Roseomonas nepalensis]|uniref:Crp/Fnr family transcriptional regulator n=1 Tax=Muricoccus nepalensis TaxID=1854500 RepID=A0A502GFR9_9PROT|nr:Crp/Fnr family transcriptional regulator [Roseomonas nepalensis]TPG60452.1 Crp/Fnr family transcriptional regulator [Roseomonas nepalensis]